MKILIFLLAIIIAVAIGNNINAEITFWVDENGVKHWSNEERPNTGGAEAKRRGEFKYRAPPPPPQIIYYEREDPVEYQQPFDPLQMMREWDREDKERDREDREQELLDEIDRLKNQTYNLRPDENSSYDNRWIMEGDEGDERSYIIRPDENSSYDNQWILEPE